MSGMAEDTPLAGRVAYVTGAARGQGRSHCVRLTRKAPTSSRSTRAGRSRPAMDIPRRPPPISPRPSPWSRARAARSWPAKSTSAIPDGQQRVVADAVEQFGRLDIVVANAGVLNKGRLWGISPPAVEQEHYLDINLTGVWNTVRRSSPMIKAGDGGSIIDVSSATASRRFPAAGLLATKFGVVALTNSLAIEFGEYGIRVNPVDPYEPISRWATTWRCTRCSPTTRHYIHSFSPGALQPNRSPIPT